jgi:hypothetical protein
MGLSLLGLASAVILKSESRGTHDHILLFQIWDSPNLEGQVPISISARNRVARLYPETLLRLARATVEEFDPASTLDQLITRYQSNYSYVNTSDQAMSERM